jgi:hypothetical protein
VQNYKYDMTGLEPLIGGIGKAAATGLAAGAGKTAGEELTQELTDSGRRETQEIRINPEDCQIEGDQLVCELNEEVR